MVLWSKSTKAKYGSMVKNVPMTVWSKTDTKKPDFVDIWKKLSKVFDKFRLVRQINLTLQMKPFQWHPSTINEDLDYNSII